MVQTEKLRLDNVPGIIYYCWQNPSGRKKDLVRKKERYFLFSPDPLPNLGLYDVLLIRHSEDVSPSGFYPSTHDIIMPPTVVRHASNAVCQKTIVCLANLGHR